MQGCQMFFENDMKYSETQLQQTLMTNKLVDLDCHNEPQLLH